MAKFRWYNKAMKPEDQQIPPPSVPQPVAYDANGQPLYAQPPPQPVYMARPHQPVEQHISPETIEKHKQSKALYPELNLSEGEYVISAIRRHPIGLLAIWAVVGLIIVLTFLGLPIFAANEALVNSLFGSSGAADRGIGILALVLLFLNTLFVLGGIIATIVYLGNKFFLTNESVTQIIQTSLFSKKEQTISLINIEDASFRKHGLLQHFLNYGSLRLSTQGDETTYRFNYVSDPKTQVSLLNDAVEDFKNGRPIDN